MNDIMLDKFIASINETENLLEYPTKKRLKEGPVAIIECNQEIPCNPCETICKKKAIIVGKPIINIPKIDYDKCSGCGKCVAICPGLAIFVINNKISDKEASISIPYELFPLPKKGDIVNALDRNGKFVCKGKIINIVNSKSNDRTAVVTFSIPKNFFKVVRNFKLRKENNGK